MGLKRWRDEVGRLDGLAFQTDPCGIQENESGRFVWAKDDRFVVDLLDAI